MRDNRETVPQSGGKKRKGAGRGRLFFRTASMLLMMNMTLLMVIQVQLNDMNESLDCYLDQMTVKEMEVGILDQNYYSGAERTVLSQKKEQEGVEDSIISETACYIEVDYAQLCGLPQVDKPKRRSEREVLERLEELSEENEIIARIYQNSGAYSDKMLEALANNPEMARFVEGYLEWDGAVDAELTEAEREQDFPLFLQWDPRWGYQEYGAGGVIGYSGCGPTCVSMVLYYLLRDETLTPDKIADYSMENGYYLPGTGTKWSLLKDVPELYGIKVYQPKASEKNMQKALDQGKVIICSVRPGEFTAIGHFIVIYGYDEEGFLVNDPNCVARSRQKWPYSMFSKEIKNMWTYEKTS